jgi:hypothetical protein
MLASRVYRRVRFQPLTRSDVLAGIPAYHPLYVHAEPDLIRLMSASSPARTPAIPPAPDRA